MSKRIKDYEWFKSLSVTVKCTLMLLILICAPVIAIASIFIQKGIYVYFGFSAFIFLQFVHSCRTRKYTYERVLFYDILLTGILTMFGFFLPSFNFLPLTLKDVVIFWNFYIGLIVFGFIAARVGIKKEISEEVYVDEFSEAVPELGG